MQKFAPLRLVGIFLAVVLLPASLSFGKPKKDAAKSKASKHVLNRLVIRSVGTDSITVSDGNNVTTVYKVDAFTDVEYQGLKVPLSDLKPTMPVQVTQGTGGTATLISATDVPNATTNVIKAPKPKKN